VSYVLAIIKYYKYGTTKDVFNHIRHVYGASTSGAQVRGWRMEATRRMTSMLSQYATESQRR
jgi:hypothetical protein